MKDIRSLYEAAKYNGRSTDVSAYVEAVDQLLESNPRGALSNVEYIISSGHGTQGIMSMMERYGLPIVSYEPLMESINEIIEHGQSLGKDTSDQEKLQAHLEAFYDKYRNCFMMYESIASDEYFEERSHSNLKVAYRAAVNCANNHPIKIIYDLKDGEVTSTGKDFKSEQHGINVSPEEKAKRAKELQQRIIKKGHLDFQSKNRILAVVDLITGQRIHDEITCEGIFKMGERRRFQVKEGQMDDYPSFKSTFWPKGDKAYIGHSPEVVRKMITLGITAKENMEFPNDISRGHKIHSVQKLIYDKTKILLDMDPAKVDADSVIKTLTEIKNVLKSGTLGCTIRDVKTIRSNVDNIIKRYSDWHPISATDKKEKARQKRMSIISSGIHFALNVIENNIKSGTPTSTASNTRREAYAEAYYMIGENGEQCKKNLTKMMALYDEAAIPDLLITAASMGESTLQETFRWMKEYAFGDPVLNQWLIECAKDFTAMGMNVPYLEEIRMGSLESIVDDCRHHNNAIYKESALMDDHDAMYEYYPYEIKAIEELIAFREYQMLGLKGSHQMKCFNEIMSLYEELDGLIPTDASCFNESTNPRRQTIKEIAGRLNDLSKRATKYVTYTLKEKWDRNLYGTPTCIRAAMYDRKGSIPLFGGIKKLIEKNMEDISDFNDEWMDGIFLFICWSMDVKSGTAKKVMNSARAVINDALKPLIDDETIKPFNSLRVEPTESYNCWVAFKVSKTYAVGDSDIGMFESVDEIVEDVADKIIPMMGLPNGNIYEGSWMLNTRNKKTGSAPSYLSQNHDIGWGEGDSPKKKDTSDDESEPTLDDFRRPSAMAGDGDAADQEPEDTSSSEAPASKEDEQRAINNYYYYTYNNSLNKNSHSFNKTQKDDHSVDDHSVRTHSDDHSVRSKDDHSKISRHDDHSSTVNNASTPDDVDGGKPADKPVKDYTDPDDEYKDYGEASKNLSRDFTLYGMKFELPESISVPDKLKIEKDEAEKLKEKAHAKMLEMINSPKKIEAIEKAIIEEERQIGENSDTDETRIERIRKYLGKASIKHYECTSKGNAKFKIDIPHIDGVVCAWEEHELWITSDGKAAFYDEVEFYEAAQNIRSTPMWDKECGSFMRLFNLDLNKLGDVKSPDKKIAITIGAHRFTFVSSLGNVAGTNEKLKSYTQVPTAVHQFNVHKSQICSDKIGIDRCILHYLKLRDPAFDPEIGIDAAVKKYGVKSKNIVFNPHGNIGLTFCCNLDDNTFAVLIDNDLACQDGSKDILFTEGFFDKLKAGAKNLVKKVKGLVGMKKSLANLQMLDDPDIISKPVPMTIPGTNIVLQSNKQPQATAPAQPQQESMTVDMGYTEVTNDLERLLNEGYYITERFRIPKIPGFRHESIEQVVGRLRRKFNAEILFIENDGPLTAQIGPASVIETNRETINKILKGDSLDTVPSKITGYDGEMDRVILVNARIMRAMRIKSPEAIELIISHEYGHVLTYGQLTTEDWLEYQIKRQMINSLGTLALMNGICNNAAAEANLMYYKLKPEALANQAMHINPYKLNSVVLGGVKCRGSIPGIDLDKIITWTVPAFIMEQTRMTAKGQNIPAAGLIENLKYTKTFYKDIITNQELYRTIIEGCDTAIKQYEMIARYHGESAMVEAVGDADDQKPQSDHPIKDVFQDIDRTTVKYQQAAKKKVQDIQNAGRAMMKPVNRSKTWITKMVMDWKDKDENSMKEKMADPHARNNLFNAIRSAIKYGTLAKAGILLNPVFLCLSLFNVKNKRSKEFRIRNEMIGELKTELKIIDEKIKDADGRDNAAKYKLMRLRNEINKKLLRVGGTKEFKKII